MSHTLRGLLAATASFAALAAWAQPASGPARSLADRNAIKTCKGRSNTVAGLLLFIALLLGHWKFVGLLPTAG